MSKRRQPDGAHRKALRQAALDYAARGWLVLPLDGKRPLTANGFKDASGDPKQIERWWRQHPDANVGVACADSDLFVIDVDSDEGERTLAALVERHGTLPRTVGVNTGGGGRHLFFAAPLDLDVPGRLGEGVDLKYHGYVVAPPSVHPKTGKRYAWADSASPDEHDLAPAPTQWIARATERGGSTRGRFTDEDWAVPEGAVHEAMVSIAGTARHHLAFAPDEIECLLTMLSERGRFGEAPEDRQAHIAQVARSMANYAPGTVPWRYMSATDTRSIDSSRLRLRTLADAAQIADEPVDWVVPDLLAAGEKAVIAGPPKSMKTWLALHLLRCVACGGDVLEEDQWRVVEPQPVLFVQEEGSAQRWARRLVGTFGGDLEPPFAYVHRGGFALTSNEHVEWVIAQAREHDARLIVLDPWQRVTPGVKENDATETGPAWDAVHRIASETGAAVVVIHHASKGDGQPTMDSIRGSSRMAGEVDLIVVLRKKERGTLEMFLDGRDLVRADGEDGNLEVAYTSDRPHEMRTTGVKIKAGGAKQQRTREAVVAVLERATTALSTSGVRAGVATHLGESRTRTAVDQELQALADEGQVTKNAQGKGRPTFWEWRR